MITPMGQGGIAIASMGSLWTPAVFGAEIDLWLEDGDLATGAVNSGWTCRQNVGRTFAQGTGANQPAKQGGGGVLFDGSNDSLTRSYESWMAMPSTGTGYSQWTVTSRTDTTTYHALGVNRGSVTVWDSYLPVSATNAHLQRGGSGAGSGTFNTGTIYLVGLTHTSAGALLAHRGTTQTTSTSGPVGSPADDGTTAGFIGTRSDGVTRTKGLIYAILLIRRSLTTDEIANLAAYCNNKWGASLT